MPTSDERPRRERRLPDGIFRVDRSKPYQAQVYDARSGKRVRRSFATLEEARTWRASFTTDLKAGRVAASPAPRLDEAADALIAGMESGAILARGGKRYRGSVCRKYRLVLDAYVIPEFGSLRLNEITHVMLLDHVERMLGDGRAPGTIRNAFDPLRVIFRRAVARGTVFANPTTNLELPGGDRTQRDRVADPAEAAALIAALSTPLDRALWGTALYAALRAGELRALRWRHVDFLASRINVVEAMDDKRATTSPKTRKGTRHVPIAPNLRRLLVELRGDAIPSPDGYVFAAWDGRAFAPMSIYKRARADWKAAELTGITLHESRHSCISTWIAAGVNPRTVMEYAGHASIVVTFDRYGHLMPNADAEALERISAYQGGSTS